MTSKTQIPIPPDAVRYRWDFRSLAVGDSIWVAWPQRRKLRAAASSYASNHPEFLWASKRMPDPNDPLDTWGVRLWRIDKFPDHS